MKNNLNEEIEKFRKLSGVLNEATGPTSWVAEFLGMIKAGVKRVPDDLLKSDELKDLVKSGKVTLTAAKGIQSIDWAKLSVDEIMVLFKWDYILDTFKQLVAKNKIDVSETAIDTYKGSFKKIAEAYTRSTETIAQSFKAGWKVKGAPTLFAKSVARNIPFISKFTRSYITKLKPEELKKVHSWFWTGVGDFSIIKATLQRNGWPNAIANFTGQIFKKWAFWTGLFTGANFLYDCLKDVPEETQVYDNELEAAWDRLVKAWEPVGLHWVFPVAVIYNELVSPLLLGGAQGRTVAKAKRFFADKKTKAEQEAEALENMKNSTKEPTGDTTTKKNSYSY
jgi:hypothetical protein